MTWLLKLSRLSLREAIILAQAWALFLLLEAGLLVLPFRSLLRLGRGHQEQSHDSDTNPSAIARIAWLVETAARYSFKTTCLKQALVFTWLLQRRGIRPLLRIGVARRSGAFEAHAWLERDGQIILGFHDRKEFEPLFLSETTTS